MSGQQRRGRPRERIQWVTVIVAVVVTLGILVYLGYGLGWTGFGQSSTKEGVQPAKTLWEWLGLLFVPTMLALGAFLLNRLQKQHEYRIQEAQERHEKWVQQREKEREELAASQRAQNE